MKFDENLAAVHAYLCSDGYVIKNPPIQKQRYYYIGFRNTNETLLKDFQKKFYNYFGVLPRLRKGERCIVQKKDIYYKLIERFGSFYSKDWKVPKINKNILGIWLRAVFDCEGWVTVKSHQSRMVGLEIINFEGAKGIRKFLSQLGIESKIKKRKGRNLFGIYIYGKKNLINFRKKIGFLHPDKKKKIDEALSDYVVYSWIFPRNKIELVNFTRSLMIEKAKMKKDNGIFRIISKNEENLINLSKTLEKLFDIESIIRKRINGIGTIYFELNINKKAEVLKLIKNNLIGRDYKKEWLKLKG
ncbi:hypothetical protein GW924_04285 [Candidatus Pacearchaeota archaeon]|nr:hypothetical protein [Candidatus Pacearchaeota archaeon]